MRPIPGGYQSSPATTTSRKPTAANVSERVEHQAMTMGLASGAGGTSTQICVDVGLAPVARGRRAGPYAVEEVLGSARGHPSRPAPSDYI
jgi:hypothetical protein